MKHKKVITSILICVLAICVCACGSSKSSSAATSKNRKTSSAAASKASRSSSRKDSGSKKESTKAATAADVYKLKAETVVDPASSAAAKKYFRVYKISKGDAVYKRIAGKSFKTNGRVSLSNLRYVKVLHVGYDKKTHVGELIVNSAIASKTKSVFYTLYQKHYQIKSMKLIDNYYKYRGEDGNKADIRSMNADNTSAFNYRFITHTTSLSNHSWGRAIDLNPLENPYSKKSNGVWYAVDHPELNKYARNRSSKIPHVITRKDTAYKTFVKAGFFWGGNWTQTPDYQHFEYR
ncbi:MAG: M15 family metallopeptidase [Eubacterium sp.]